MTMLAALTASFITAGEQGWLAPLPGALLAAALSPAGSSSAPNAATRTRSCR